MIYGQGWPDAGPGDFLGTFLFFTFFFVLSQLISICRVWRLGLFKPFKTNVSSLKVEEDPFVICLGTNHIIIVGQIRPIKISIDKLH
jgi:hypothetical protein